MDEYALNTDLEKRLVLQLLQLFLSLDVYRICRGNWNTAQLTTPVVYFSILTLLRPLPPCFSTCLAT